MEASVSRCLMCGTLNDELDPLGYCDECEHDVVYNLVNQLTKPLYVYRMALAQYSSLNTPQARSARTRKKNAEKEIIRIIASA